MQSEVFVFLCKSWGYTRMILKSGGEPSITSLVTAVQKEWVGDSNKFQTQLIPRTSPVITRQNGAAEATVHSLEGPTSKLCQKQVCCTIERQNRVEVPQPVTVEPDPMVRRGLKKASEDDPEIAEICSWISDVNVNEEPHPQVPVGEFTDEEEWQALG